MSTQDIDNQWNLGACPSEFAICGSECILFKLRRKHDQPVAYRDLLAVRVMRLSRARLGGRLYPFLHEPGWEIRLERITDANRTFGD